MLKKKSDDYKEESKEKFNKQAEKFDSDKTGKHSRELYDNILHKLSQFSFNKLLDVGCGTGNLLSLITKKYEIQLSGVDLSPNMLNIANEKLGEKADLRLGDSENLPFKDESFDMVTCTDSFHHYPHPENVLAEIKRVLNPKGTLLIADPWAPTPFRQLVNMYMRLFSKGGNVKLYSKNDIHKLLNNSGFKNIKWEPIKDKNAFIVTCKSNLTL
ncbi:MAG: class I SAM-dependent methyltransferase [Methanobacterium sp.]